MTETLLFDQIFIYNTGQGNHVFTEEEKMNLSCAITFGLTGVIAVTLIYYFYTEWNAE
jgi:hypothetical protein